MVKVYSIPDCPWCQKAKDYLKKRGINYMDLNVQENIEARNEMLRLSKQQGVPVINIDGNIIVGFDKPQIDKLLVV